MQDFADLGGVPLQGRMSASNAREASQGAVLGGLGAQRISNDGTLDGLRDLADRLEAASSGIADFFARFNGMKNESAASGGVQPAQTPCHRLTIERLDDLANRLLNQSRMLSDIG